MVFAISLTTYWLLFKTTQKCSHLLAFIFTAILALIALSSHETKIRIRKLFRKKMEALDTNDMVQLFQESQQIAAETKEHFEAKKEPVVHFNIDIEKNKQQEAQPKDVQEVAQKVESEEQNVEPLPVEELPADNSKQKEHYFIL